MTRWLQGIVDPELVPVVSWAIIGFVALVALWIAWRILRAMTSGSFIARGRGRKARLAVMDVAAVDDKRRLVLVRRDDVEHLILIGGSSDIVVEHDIRLVAKPARPVPAEGEAPTGAGEDVLEPRAPVFAPPAAGHARGLPSGTQRPSVVPRPAERPLPPLAQRPAPAVRAVQPPAPPQAQPPRPVHPQAVPHHPPAQTAEPRREPHAPAARVAEPVPARPSPQPVARATPAAVPAPPRADPDLDDALLAELRDSLEDAQPVAAPETKSLEDEMAKLLGELSRQRK